MATDQDLAAIVSRHLRAMLEDLARSGADATAAVVWVALGDEDFHVAIRHKIKLSVLDPSELDHRILTRAIEDLVEACDNGQDE